MLKNSEHMVNALEDITKELYRAIELFPEWPTDPLHAVSIIGEEFGELTQAVLDMTYAPHKVCVNDIKEEAIQTAAMAIRFYINLKHYEYKKSMTHKQDDLSNGH